MSSYIISVHNLLLTYMNENEVHKICLAVLVGRYLMPRSPPDLDLDNLSFGHEVYLMQEAQDQSVLNLCQEPFLGTGPGRSGGMGLALLSWCRMLKTRAS